MRVSPTRVRLVAAIGLGSAVVPLDTAVNIGFPAITAGFGLAIGDIQWVVIAYVLTYASLMLAVGRIGDILGHAAIFRVGLAWSAVAYLLCALAPSFPLLLACRVLQGIGAALLLSCGAALITGLYGEERRSRLLGIYTMVHMAGMAVGPWLGGALVEAWGWPAVFWFRAPVALVALLALHGLPRRAPAAARAPFDAVGAGLLALALLALLLALNRAGEPTAALPLALLAVLAMAGFVQHERRTATPLIDLAVFRLPGFAVLNLASVLVNLAAFAVWLLVPYYLARQSGLGLAGAGLVLAAGSIGAIIASPAGVWLAGRVAAARLALAGAVLVALGLWLIGRWTAGTPALWLVPGLVVQGVGIGLFQFAYLDIVAATLPRANRGVAGSLAMLTRTVGTLGAAALLGLAFQSLESAQGFLPAFRHSFQAAGLLALVVAAALLPALRRR